MMLVAHDSERQQNHLLQHPLASRYGIGRVEGEIVMKDGRVKETMVSLFSSMFCCCCVFFYFFFISSFIFFYLTPHERNLETTISLALAPEKNKVYLNGSPSASMEVENSPEGYVSIVFPPFSIDPGKGRDEERKERNKMSPATLRGKKEN